jgi:hypothetical protein
MSIHADGENTFQDRERTSTSAQRKDSGTILGSVVKLNSEKRDGANKECGDKGTNIFEVP